MNIEPQIIQDFLENLFDRCGRSKFKMEECLKEFVLGGTYLYGMKIDDPDECEKEEECYIVQNQENEINSLRYNMKALKENTIILEGELDKAYKKYEELKENSVLFSMDEL